MLVFCCTAFFHKMDTSSGLSSIASLSLGFTMSMRPGGMAFAANRAGPLSSGPWSPGLAGAWTVKPPASSDQSTGSAGPSPLRQSSDRPSTEKESDPSAVESCRSLVVPCVSLVTAPLASKDRPVDPPIQTSDPPPVRPVSPILETAEDLESSSTDDDDLTITSTSNADCSTPIIDVSNPVDSRTVPEGPVLQLPSPSRVEPPPDSDQTVVILVDETSPTEGRRNRGSSSVMAVDRLEEARRPSLSHIGRSAARCSDRESITSADDSVPSSPSSLDRQTNSGGGVSVPDDVVIVVDDDDDDLVGTFFTPSIDDSFAAAGSFSPLRREAEPLREIVRDGFNPVQPVPDVPDDDTRAQTVGSATAAPLLLKNGADSSAVCGWPSTNRFALEGVGSAPRAEGVASSSAASSFRRKNPFVRLVRHRKDAVCFKRYAVPFVGINMAKIACVQRLNYRGPRT